MAGDASRLVNTKQVNSLQRTTIGSRFAVSSRFLVSFSIYFLWFFAINNNNNNADHGGGGGGDDDNNKCNDFVK